MKTSARLAGLVFVVIAVADTIFLAAGNETVPSYIKPFLIPSLAVAALCALLPEHKGRLTYLLVTGMAFHTAGDILLEFSDRDFLYFALGLGSFFIGHIFYLCVLCHGLKLKGGKELLAFASPLVIAPFAAAAFGMEFPMSAALTVYAMALLFITASGVVWAIRSRSFAWRIAAGGIIFIFSDILVAVKAFSDIDFPFRHAIVIATYLAAEWLLVSTMTRWIKE